MNSEQGTMGVVFDQIRDLKQRNRRATQLRDSISDKACVKPRPISKNTTYLVTRRTTQRLFLLRPSRKINACIRYCMALAQRRSGIEVHCAVFLSNHYHLVVTDVHGTLPIFTEELNKLLAKSLNCHHGRWENFWAGGDQTSHVRLEGEEEVLDKTVYSLANPTEAKLVSHGTQWPGVRLFHQGDYLAKKPGFFFRSEEAGGLPDRLKLRLTPPPIGVQPQLANDVVKNATSKREAEIRASVRGKKCFLGAATIKAQNIYSSPRWQETRRGMSPRLSCRDKWRRIEQLAVLEDFVREHGEIRQRYMAGDKTVVFPVGTYRFLHQFGARCAKE